MAASIRKVRLLLHSPQYLTTPRTRAWRACTEEWRMFSSSVPDVVDEDDKLLPDSKFDFIADSLSARGYLRTQKPYSPPTDVDTQVREICKKVLQSSARNTTFVDAATKFTVLKQCSQALGHAVPNSLLHKINNVGDLVAFYKAEVDTTVPLDRLKQQNLPKNLHVINNYTRFHSETDTKFGGVSVFTRDSTLVTGLKTKKKYPGNTVRSRWPYE
ncbi:hypothetical protein Pcinc_034205 [Petrolisthes cinctipes]|uniref:Large ribosomal subunit protein mL50 n=1 Tax=Petrolisthes cinctipes TaxID=88211 RepID=A0AAE1EQP2_PETCI|nr:hypothetical protein Pcinc_034205 [Petrolisthes cinctipes]